MFGINNSMRAIHRIGITLWLLTAPAWAAYEFNGSNQYLQYVFDLGTLPDISEASGAEFSVFCWMWTDATGVALSIADYDVGDDFYEIFHLPLTTYNKRMLPTQWGEMTPQSSCWTSGEVPYGQWNCVSSSLWYADGKSKLRNYVNGSLIASLDVAADCIQSDFDRLTLGKMGNQYTTSWYTGKIEQVAVWSRVLTADEHTSLSQGYAPSFFADDLRWYFPLVDDLECAVSTASLTAYNSPSVVEGPTIIYPSEEEPPAPVIGKGGYGLFPGMRRH